MPNLKNPLILFIIFVVLFVVAKIVYAKYCESKPEGCKKVKVDKDSLSGEGIDW